MKRDRSPTRSFRLGQTGNIAIMTACSLLVLLGFASLVVDGGYLFSEKEKFQNAAEAGAMAGARHLHESADTCKKYAANIVRANGVPDTATLEVKLGYYDVSSRSFDEDPEETTPVNETVGLANNAVRVSVEVDIGTAFARTLAPGNDPVKVSADAVAYGIRPTFVAHGKDGIDMQRLWKTGYSKYQGCVLSSKGPVKFQGSESFERTWVETDAAVSNGGGVAVYSPEEEIGEPDIDWNGLHAQAEANGRVYECNDSWPSEWTADDCSPPNYYKHKVDSDVFATTNNYFFLPADGDHEGRTYYFNFDNSGADPILRIWNDGNALLLPKNRTVYHFTIVTKNAYLSTYPIPAGSSVLQSTTIGDFPGHGNDGLVFIYCDEINGVHRHWYTQSGHWPIAEPKGVILKMPGEFTMETQWSTADYYLRVYAEKIRIYAPSPQASAIRFMGDFGPVERISLGRR